MVMYIESEAAEMAVKRLNLVSKRVYPVDDIRCAIICTTGTAECGVQGRVIKGAIYYNTGWKEHLTETFVTESEYQKNCRFKALEDWGNQCRGKG